jgi:hypothetical protein
MKIGNLEVYGIIYKVENLVNGKTYIGQTGEEKGFNGRYNRKGQGIERLYKRHKTLKDYGHEYNNHLLNSIEKYGFNSFKVIEMFDVAFTQEELNIKEICWISIYDSFKNGYNRTLGGDGLSGYEGSIKENNPMSRSVIQLSLDGVFIREWNCITYVEEELGISTSHIVGVCNNKYGRKSSGGYLWVYKEDYKKDTQYQHIIEENPNKKSIVQLSLKGEYVNTYNSLQEAVDKNNELKVKGISKCCNNTRKSYKGYIWVFKEEYNKSNNYTYNTKSGGKSKDILVFDNNMFYYIQI